MIVAFPHPPGSGGPGSFQVRFENALKNSGWRIVYAGSDEQPDLIMVVGGTKRLAWLWQMKRRGVPIVYRLDGINWLHRKKKVGLKNFLIAEYRNWNNKIIHAFFADFIVYQSEFVRSWWEKSSLRNRGQFQVIHNGVDLKEFCPGTDRAENIRLVCLEGTIDYSPYAVRLLNDLRTKLPAQIPFELYGRFEDEALQRRLNANIDYRGLVPRQDVPQVLQGAIYLSLDVNPACPNGVVEALAAGAPVVAFDTGALPELVTSDAGKIVTYGSDPWQLGYPDSQSLAAAVIDIWYDFPVFSKAARSLAEEKYDLREMTDKYLYVIDRLLTEEPKL